MEGNLFQASNTGRFGARKQAEAACEKKSHVKRIRLKPFWL
jgi:hypothetical protein